MQSHAITFTSSSDLSTSDMFFESWSWKLERLGLRVGMSSFSISSFPVILTQCENRTSLCIREGPVLRPCITSSSTCRGYNMHVRVCDRYMPVLPWKPHVTCYNGNDMCHVTMETKCIIKTTCTMLPWKQHVHHISMETTCITVLMKPHAP